MKTNNMTTSHLRESLSRSPLRLAFFLITLALARFALLPTAEAASNTDTQLGTQALSSKQLSGVNDTALGYQALKSNTTGNGNTATGSQALIGNTIGNNNTATGFGALTTNTTASENTATGFQALYSHAIGSDNTAVGFQALSSQTDGDFNTAFGARTLYSYTTGFGNLAVGNEALSSLTSGESNTAVGNACLINTSGTVNFNTALGRRALFRTQGDQNIGLGFFAGSNLNGGTNNIFIGNVGPVPIGSESNTIRIGTQIPATATVGNPPVQSYPIPAHTATFIAGIYGASTSDAGSTTAVVIDMNGNLGTAASSERFKRDIRPMDNGSEAILALKPVMFHYKNDGKSVPQFGLIAEEVANVSPDLVVRDRKGEIYTVRYEAVNAMLLNEFLKEHKKVEKQEATITRLTNEFQTVSTQQRNEIQLLSAQLKEQAAQIQKVSAQLEVSKPAPQVVKNP